MEAKLEKVKRRLFPDVETFKFPFTYFSILNPPANDTIENDRLRRLFSNMTVTTCLPPGPCTLPATCLPTNHSVEKRLNK